MFEISSAQLLREFITLFVVVDPIGSLPVFYFATSSVAARFHWKFALRGVLVAALVLYFFLIAGQVVIEAIGLRLGSFQIAGGIILFLFALTMIFGPSKPAREIEEAEHTDLSGAVYPLAIPSIASPGAMLAIVILTDNNRNSVSDQLVTAGVLGVVLLITLLLLLLAARLKRVIGTTGADVISRVMGMILATVAVDSVLNGFETLGLFAVQG